MLRYIINLKFYLEKNSSYTNKTEEWFWNFKGKGKTEQINIETVFLEVRIMRDIKSGMHAYTRFGKNVCFAK